MTAPAARPYVEVARAPRQTINELYRTGGAMAEAMDLCRLAPVPAPDKWYGVDATGRPIMMYFIHNPVTRMIKIGISVEVVSRMMALEAACGCELILLGFNYGGRGAEYWFHQHFRPSRRKGEWFDESPKLFAIAEDFHERGLKFVVKKYRISLP